MKFGNSLLTQSVKTSNSAFLASCLAITALSLIPTVSEAALIVPESFTFTQTLKLGSNVDPDVKYLQNILNRSDTMKVATSGPGSDKNLTSLFDEKTEASVIKFQALYANDILVPAKLKAPTGIVGPLTRAKLNSILKYLIEYEKATKLAQAAQKTTATSSISINTELRATTSAPTIKSITPNSSAFLTQIVLINGSNFTSDNTIRTNLGDINHAFSTDGNTLNFTVGELPLYEKALQLYKGKKINVTLQIINKNGTSTEQAAHTISFPASGALSDTSPNNITDMLKSVSDYQKFVASSTASIQSSYNYTQGGYLNSATSSTSATNNLLESLINLLGGKK